MRKRKRELRTREKESETVQSLYETTTFNSHITSILYFLLKEDKDERGISLFQAALSKSRAPTKELHKLLVELLKTSENLSYSIKVHDLLMAILRLHPTHKSRAIWSPIHSPSPFNDLVGILDGLTTGDNSVSRQNCSLLLRYYVSIFSLEFVDRSKEGLGVKGSILSRIISERETRSDAISSFKSIFTKITSSVAEKRISEDTFLLQRLVSMLVELVFEDDPNGKLYLKIILERFLKFDLEGKRLFLETVINYRFKVYFLTYILRNVYKGFKEEQGRSIFLSLRSNLLREESSFDGIHFLLTAFSVGGFELDDIGIVELETFIILVSHLTRSVFDFWSTEKMEENARYPDLVEEFFNFKDIIHDVSSKKRLEGDASILIDNELRLMTFLLLEAKPKRYS